MKGDHDVAVHWSSPAQGTPARCADITPSIEQMQAVDELVLQIMRIWHQDSSDSCSDKAAFTAQAACTILLLTPPDHQSASRETSIQQPYSAPNFQLWRLHDKWMTST